MLEVDVGGGAGAWRIDVEAPAPGVECSRDVGHAERGEERLQGEAVDGQGGVVAIAVAVPAAFGTGAASARGESDIACYQAGRIVYGAFDGEGGESDLAGRGGVEHHGLEESYIVEPTVDVDLAGHAVEVHGGIDMTRGLDREHAGKLGFQGVDIERSGGTGDVGDELQGGIGRDVAQCGAEGGEGEGHIAHGQISASFEP